MFLHPEGEGVERTQPGVSTPGNTPPTAARPEAEGAPDQTSPQRSSKVYASLALSGRTICLVDSQG
jgi:hypothetical protein